MTRLRALIERPVDPEVARWVVSLALLVTIGVACLVALSATDGSVTRPGHEVDRAGPAVDRPVALSPNVDRRHHGRQDPQDRPGTSAHRLAERELATHRALQHVPWRGEGVSISLVGARAGKAVLAVEGSALAADSLQKMGYMNVASMAGGFKAWKDAGLPTE